LEPGAFQFERFTLDLDERQLRRDDAPIALNGRYLDALALLVREQGRLVSKDRFLGEVWRGVPVTDEALTQCIKTLRQRLGDAAASPRFIETVPKHGYRFIAPVEWVGKRLFLQNLRPRPRLRRRWATGAPACTLRPRRRSAAAAPACLAAFSTASPAPRFRRSPAWAPFQRSSYWSA
jgi:DNA-binding winged helix-turn-helix (wHTH) protein